LSLFGLLDRIRYRRSEPRRIGWLGKVPYAHRGLHGSRNVENSRAAITAAVEAGYGIEVDARLSLDGMAYVFHDATLERLTDASGEFRRKAGHDLSQIKLKGSDETIPRLAEILAIVAGRVPILIEIKTDGGAVAQTCVAVRHALAGYRGTAAVMSFSGDVAHWFAQHGEHITRGLILSGKEKKEARDRHFVTRAEFVAVDVRDLPSRFITRLRKRRIPVLTWTVRDPRAQAIAAAHADQIIFEAPGW
jgi:glycerophosphoryl diester phosphodiesterase